MEKENIEAEITKSLKELLVEADRVNEIFAQNIAHLKEDSKEVLKALPRLTLEVEQIKKIRENLSSFLAEKMKEAYLKESKDFSDRLSTAFLEKAEKGLQAQKKQYEDSLETIRDAFHDQIHREKEDMKRDLDKHAAQVTEIHEKYRDGSDKFTKDMEGTVSTLKQLLNLQKQRLTRKGLLICGVFCLASVLTGMGLFYFFPQNIYYSDVNTARYMMMGRSTWENMKHLSVKDQNLLLDGMKKYMAKK
jgi:hypothetical protein